MDNYEDELEKHNSHIEEALHDSEEENKFYYWAIERLILQHRSTYELYAHSYETAVIDAKITELKAIYDEYKANPNG